MEKLIERCFREIEEVLEVPPNSLVNGPQPPRQVGVSVVLSDQFWLKVPLDKVRHSRQLLCLKLKATEKALQDQKEQVDLLQDFVGCLTENPESLGERSLYLGD